MLLNLEYLFFGEWEFIEQLIHDCWIERKIDVTIYYLPGTLDI